MWSIFSLRCKYFLSRGSLSLITLDPPFTIILLVVVQKVVKGNKLIKTQIIRSWNEKKKQFWHLCNTLKCQDARHWVKGHRLFQCLWRHVSPDVILLCVRWYLSYQLSYRDLVEMMDERGLKIAHSTILGWVLNYSMELKKRVRHHLKKRNQSWRMDETYIKVNGEWKCLC